MFKNFLLTGSIKAKISRIYLSISIVISIFIPIFFSGLVTSNTDEWETEDLKEGMTILKLGNNIGVYKCRHHTAGTVRQLSQGSSLSLAQPSARFINLRQQVPAVYLVQGRALIYLGSIAVPGPTAVK